MEPITEKPKILGLAVYIPLILTVFFLFLATAEQHFSQIYVLGFIPNPFYTSDPLVYEWGIGQAILAFAFWFLAIVSLITTVAMVVMRSILVKIQKENKPVSNSAKIISIILIFLIITAVWYIYQSGVH